jgi:hypothetical protein
MRPVHEGAGTDSRSAGTVTTTEAGNVMGIALVKAAARELRGNTKLSANARAVLLLMAATALDTEGKRGQPPRTYFGGWLNLQWELRGSVTPASEKAVNRAMRELADQGLIVKVRHAGQTTAAYELLL